MGSCLFKVLFRTSVLVGLAGLSMGNKGCKEAPTQPEARELKRRAQIGEITAPQGMVTSGGFDFKFAANAQMYEALRKTNSFTTALTDLFDPGHLSENDKDAFYTCEDDRQVGVDQFSAMGMQKGVFSQKAACLFDAPAAVISGAVTNFQLTSSKGLTLDIPKWSGFGASVDLKKATLTMSFRAKHPLIPGLNMAATTSRANQQQRDISLKIGIGDFGIGPRYYFQSDLSKVVSDAMETALVDLKEQLSINNDDSSLWYAYVTKNCDKGILINAGGAADSGLRVGDMFEVYNVWYQWQDQACSSDLKSSLRDAKPSRLVKVVTVGDTMSFAEVVEDYGGPLYPGARVYIKKLVDPNVQPSAPDSPKQKLSSNP